MSFFDCFAAQEYNGKFSCKALTVMDCNECSFFKTKEQVREERKAAEARHKKVGWMKGDKE